MFGHAYFMSMFHKFLTTRFSLFRGWGIMFDTQLVLYCAIVNGCSREPRWTRWQPRQ